MRRRSPDSTFGRSPDSPDCGVHLIPRTPTRDPRRHRFDAVVADFVAACRAKDLSTRTIEFYLEGLNSYRVFAGRDDRDLALADLELAVARAWLADFVARGRQTATVAGRARALRASVAGSVPRGTSEPIQSSDSKCRAQGHNRLH